MPTISKNIFWSTLTSILQLYTGSIVFIVLAKLMSVNDFGILSFGASLSALIVIVSDFGFSLMIIKDYPQQHSNFHKYLENSIWAKILLSILTGLIFLSYLLSFYNEKWTEIGGVYILFAITSSFIVYFQALLKIQNRFHKYAESTLLYSITITLTIFIYWLYDIRLIELVACLLISKIIQLLWIIYLCKSSFNRLAFDLKAVWNLVKTCWSFGLHTIFGIFYFMVDTQIISLYLGAKDVALYQSVFRIILVLLLFSDIINNVLLPYLSYKYFKKESLSILVPKIFLYMLIVGCSLFLIFTSFKREILSILYTPEYLEAVILVLPFSIVVIIRTSSALLGNILTISNKQIYRVLTGAVSLIISIILNFIFIPKYGIVAAAWISVLVHLVLFIMYFYYSKMVVSSIRLFQIDNVLLILGSIIIYVILSYSNNGSLNTIFTCITFWIITILFVMSRNNNFKFLRQVLKENGVG